MRARILATLASAILSACTVSGPQFSGPTEPPVSGPQFSGPVGPPPVPEGWDPEGRGQLVIYGRSADDAVDIGVQITSPGHRSWQAGGLGSGGCQAVTYPWGLSVGPEEGDPNLYAEIANSGDVTEGTMTIWMDTGPNGVTMGWGKPDWATEDSSTNCGE